MVTRRKRPAPKPRAADEEGARLVLENVRCFQHAEVPLGKQVTVIIGQNGSGKTTIAEALASLAYGEGAGWEEVPLRSGATSGSVVLEGGARWPSARWVGEKREPLMLGQLFAYGQYRAVKPPPRKGGDPMLLGTASMRAELRPLPENLAEVQDQSATSTVFRFDEDHFRDLGAFAALLHDEGARNPAAAAAWKKFANWIAGLDRRVEDVVIAEHEGRPRAMFRRLGTTLPISDLSDGYRAMLAVVLDLVIRYAAHFGGLEQPLDGQTIVVIDEVDLNLHPRWQRQIIKQLTTLFPHTRFVLTTHSASVVQAAIDERELCEVLVLKEDEKGRGSIVVPWDAGKHEDLDGAEVDSVLVEVFDTPSRYSPTYEAVEDRATSLREKIEDGSATPEDRRALLAALDALQSLMAREEERKGTGPLMSGIAKTQLALLRAIEAQVHDKKGGRRDPAPTKKRPRSR
jgi:hypothetical protein